MNITDDRKELFKAISKAQGEFTTVSKNAMNPHFKSKFAPLDSIIEMTRPILPKHGLSAMQLTDISADGVGVIIETVIAHESGQYISSKMFMPVVKNDPQGYGSSISYGRRYALAAALGIVSDEDVDGNGSGDKQKGGEQQPQPQKQQPLNGPQSKSTPTSAGQTDPSSAAYDIIMNWIEKVAGSVDSGKRLSDWFLNDANEKLVAQKSNLNAKDLSAIHRHFEATKTMLDQKGAQQ